MKAHQLFAPVAAICCVCLVSCSSESNKLVGNYEEAATIMASIKDKDSADAAADKLASVQKEIISLSQEVAKNPDLAKQMQDAKTVEAVKKYTAEMTRIAQAQFFGSEKLTKAITGM